MLGIAGAGPFPAAVRRLFAPREQRFAPYRAVLPGIVNDVSADPATLGFFGGWWRALSEQYTASTPGSASGLTIRRGGTTLTLGWGTALAATLTFLRDGARRLPVLHPGTLTTEIRLR